LRGRRDGHAPNMVTARPAQGWGGARARGRRGERHRHGEHTVSEASSRPARRPKLRELARAWSTASVQPSRKVTRRSCVATAEGGAAKARQPRSEWARLVRRTAEPGSEFSPCGTKEAFQAEHASTDTFSYGGLLRSPTLFVPHLDVRRRRPPAPTGCGPQITGLACRPGGGHQTPPDCRGRSRCAGLWSMKGP
jgi:hypothetical protein